VVFRKDSPELETERRRENGLTENDPEQAQPTGAQVAEAGEPFLAEEVADVAGGGIAGTVADAEGEQVTEGKTRCSEKNEVDKKAEYVEGEDSPASATPTCTLGAVPDLDAGLATRRGEGTRNTEKA
jgi:hypothetical protein